MIGAANYRILREERAAAARLEASRGKAVYRSPPMQTALRKALAPILKQAGPASDSLAARWSEIVGPRLAKLTEPVRVQSGKDGATLHIRAPSAAAPMIQHAAADIMAKVTVATGAKIKAIRIVQTSGAAPAKAVAVTRRALTIEERTQLTASLRPVQTPAVKLALEALGEAVMTWGPRKP